MQGKSDGVEVRARSVEEAVNQALATLGLGRDEVEIEVIRQGSRGLLGLLGEEAIVKVTPMSALTVEAEAGQEALDEAEAEVESTDTLTEEERPSSQIVDEGAVSEVGTEALGNLLKYMGVEARVEAELVPAEGQDVSPTTVLNIRGDDLGMLIGRRGETLRDLQFVTGLIVSRHTQRWPNLVVDVEHYKARREKVLKELAVRMAERVRLTGEPVALEPMPANERRIVHLSLRDDEEVFTESTGQDETRKVVIKPRK